MSASTAAIILAAGKGTRMPGEAPKVLHEAAGAPLVRRVVDACHAVGAKPIVLVVGYGEAQVRQVFAGEADIAFVRQAEQLGTGHAVQQAEEAVRDAGVEDIFVVCGDGPLIRADTLERLRQRRRKTGAACALATAVLDDPAGYGRVLRDERGAFAGFIEEKHATPEQRAIREVNPSYYCFAAAPLFDALRQVQRDETSGEFYLTDVPSLLAGWGLGVEVEDGLAPEDALSVNTPEQLVQAERALLARTGAPTPGAKR